MEIKEIVSYIIAKYPNSCLSWNLQEPRSGIQATAEECVKFFYGERLNWCDCGMPEAAQKCIKDYLSIINIRTGEFCDDIERRSAAMTKCFGVTDVYDSPLLLCLAYAMDAAKFTEHGTGIGGAWLTEEGKMFLYVLEQADLNKREENEDE